jgi:hypothetical protein
MAGAQSLRALRVLAQAIFDVLRLVENHERKFLLAVLLDVAAQDRVRSHQEIVVLANGKIRGAIRPGEVECFQLRSKARGLAKPVRDEGGGANDESGWPSPRW